MNQKVLTTLEYNTIIEMLAGKANSAPGKKLCHELVPSTDLEEIKKNQRQTADALRRLFRDGSTSFGNNKDMGLTIRSLEIGSTLSILELLGIASLQDNVTRIKAYGRRDRSGADERTGQISGAVFEERQQAGDPRLPA